MEDDYYSLLNLNRNCTEEDIKASYKRLCIYYHPDKHCYANRESAENIYQKIKQAYEVLIDPKLRTVYDIYGVKGLESGLHLALQDLDTNQIRETYERILRQKKEKEQELATNPVSNISVQLDASGLCYSNRETYITELFNIPINSFTIAQSVEAPLTERNNATVICTAINNDDYATGLIQTRLRHTFSSDTWLESGFTFGHGANLTLNGYKRLTKFLFATCRSEVSRLQKEYITYSGGGTLGCNIGDTTTIKADIALDKTLKGVLTKSWEKLMVYLSYRIGLDTQVVTMQLVRSPLRNNPNGPHFECSAMYDLVEGAHVEYGASKQLTEYSRLAALVRVGQASGVKLKLLLTRGRHTYRFDILFSDVIEPVAVLYGTFLPLLAYSALHWLVVKPYLNKLKAEDAEAKADEIRTNFEKAREEAQQAIQLMKTAYDRNVNSEQCKCGLVLIQAWYGVFGASNKLIDVTIPLQCLVANSKLMLPENPKHGLVGFYDVSYGEKKHLAVKYKFRNVMHEVIIEDSEPLRIPKQSHKISGV